MSDDPSKKFFKLDQDVKVVESYRKTSKFGKPSLASLEESKALADSSK